MYFFQTKGQKYCIDATAETGRYGRLINHSRLYANLLPKVVSRIYENSVYKKYVIDFCCWAIIKVCIGILVPRRAQV